MIVIPIEQELPASLADLTSELDLGTAAGQLLHFTGSKWTYTETSELVWDDTNKRLGIGVADPDTKLEIFHAGNQLKLSFDGTDNCTFAVDTSGYITIAPSGSRTDITGVLEVSSSIGSGANITAVNNITATETVTGATLTDNIATIVGGVGTFNEIDVDTLNLNANVISDSTGTISFDNEHLTTTGNITGVDITANGVLKVDTSNSTALNVVDGAVDWMTLDTRDVGATFPLFVRDGFKVSRDDDAGDSGLVAAFAVGNKNASQGVIQTSFTNAAAAGAPNAVLAFQPRNNADSGAVTLGSITFRKIGTVDRGEIDFATKDSAGTFASRLTMTHAKVLVINESGADWDFRIEGDTEDNLFRVDAGTDTVRMGDWDTNYTQVSKTGDLTFVGSAGLCYGHTYGNEIAWTQASAAQNTWYDISIAAMVTGELNNVTSDGNGQLTVSKAGRYAIDWSGSFEANAANVHVQITVSINGTEDLSALNHFETVGVSRQDPCSGFTIINLAASDTVNVSIRTTDAGTPNLGIDHLMLRVQQVGG